MKKLLIVRHAKSSWDNPSLNDYDRPLNDRGKRDAPKMSFWLSKKANVDLILSSGARRALDTAKAFQATLHSPLEIDDKLYHASSKQLLSIIKSVDDEINSLMIVSHNPGINDLVHYLNSGFQENVPTCGILHFDFEVKKWSATSNKNATLQFFQYPKNL
ncbi:histidine phosphatase family protein [Marivirga arenosa]|uniref:Histidine phosphatase family protein n=1 Tax=Marivirga arenosa TaxID=3059076 RepID=A0AA49GGH4_9BACT|nr:histidine phosphatase family protein [Marivirga sp. ABR2-2]WKK85194.2 histidine phosphatase family protein [Marivirga sp. ABR2-2]